MRLLNPIAREPLIARNLPIRVLLILPIQRPLPSLHDHLLLRAPNLVKMRFKHLLDLLLGRRLDNPVLSALKFKHDLPRRFPAIVLERVPLYVKNNVLFYVRGCTIIGMRSISV